MLPPAPCNSSTGAVVRGTAKLERMCPSFPSAHSRLSSITSFAVTSIVSPYRAGIVTSRSRIAIPPLAETRATGPNSPVIACSRYTPVSSSGPTFSV